MAIHLARIGEYQITGLDISRSFVRIATENARQAAVAIDFRRGDVAHMPFPSASFDYVVCQAAFKNFPDPVAALDEIHRVLRPGAQASILDLRKDAPPDAIDAEIRGMHLSVAAELAPHQVDLPFRLAARRLYAHKLRAVVARSRFGHGEFVEDGIGFELWLVKRSSA